MKWSETDTQHLVKLYSEHENLWNPLHPDYKVKQERITSYWKIIDSFKTITGYNLTVRKLTNKIKTLRCTYILELERIMKRAELGGIYKTSLKWFADMHYCLKYTAKTKKVDPITIDSIVFEEDYPLDVDPNELIMIIQSVGGSALAEKYKTDNYYRNSYSSSSSDGDRS